MTREEKEAIKGKAINDAMCSIENRVRHVYNQGFEDGKDYYIQKYGNAYNKGLEDAWECARKIVGLGEPEDVVGCAGLRNFICEYSASEAITRLKKYEELQEQKQKWEDDFEHKQLEQLCNHLEQQKKIEKSCDNCGHRFDVSCEILDSGECCINEGRWIPKQPEKSCDNCGFSYGQYKEYCNISGCYNHEKWTQAQVCNTCRYSGDNYEKFDIGFHEKRTLHCNRCHNFDEYESLYNDDDEIRVGDQLEIIESSTECRKCVVLKIDDCVMVIYDDGEVGYINPECYRKTGKHFLELVEFIEKIGNIKPI